MTKRFHVEKQTFDGYCIVDNHFDGYYAYEKQDLEKLCENLNDLNDENDELRTKNNAYLQDIEVYKEDNTHLKLENDELKKILGFLRNDNATDILNVLNSQENQIWELKKENEQLKSTIKEVTELLGEEVDLFSDKATEHDINAYVELKELDNKDAFYMATATKKAIRMLNGLIE